MPRVNRTPPKNNEVPPSITSKSDSDIFLSSTGAEGQENLLNITKRVKRRPDDTPGNSDMIIADCRKMFDRLHSQQEFKFKVLNTSINTLIEQNTDIQKSVDFMSTQYDVLVSKMEALEKDNYSYKTHIRVLEAKLEGLERNTKSTSIEVRNIPKLELETKQSLCTTINSIRSIISAGPPIQEIDIRDIYRTKGQAIVVDFTTATRKETLVGKFKEYNKGKRLANQPPLGTSALNIPGPNKSVFLSEALTSKARRLYFLTRGLAKNKKIAATRTSYGKVLIRHEEGQPAVRINDEGDLKKFFI
jgi:hypothetical protein